MRPGGWPDAGDEWDGGTMSYETFEQYGPHETFHGVRDTRQYDSAGYGQGVHDLFSYPAEEPDTLPRGVSTHEALAHGQFRLAEPLVPGAQGMPGTPPGAPPPGPGADVPEEDSYATSWEFEEGLARLLQTSSPEPAEPLKIPRQRYAHRRRRRRLTHTVGRIKRLAHSPLPWLRLISLTMAALTAIIVAVVGALSGVISYDPLRRLAAPAGSGALAQLWPLLVYGPWLVAALSILRAAVHRRRAAHSWLVVVLFSAIAVYMCVAHVGRSPVRLAVAGLPPITALVCFHQLVRQITLTSPPRNGPRRPRHTVRRG